MDGTVKTLSRSISGHAHRSDTVYIFAAIEMRQSLRPAHRAATACCAVRRRDNQGLLRVDRTQCEYHPRREMCAGSISHEWGRADSDKHDSREKITHCHRF